MIARFMTRGQRARIALPLLVLMASVPSARADKPPIKPGLWEVTTEGQSLNGKALPDVSAQMAEQLQKMPPDMRKQMEAHMKSQGVQMMSGGGGKTAVRMCLTRDMLEQDRWQRNDGQCQNTAMNRSGATWSWKFKCTQPPGEGEGKTTFQGSDAYMTELHMTTRQEGHPQRMSMKHRGRWLGADCGDVKPLTPPGGKP